MIEKIQIICGDFQEALEGLSHESVGRLFMALIAFANDQDPSVYLEDDAIANAFFPVLKNHVQRNEEYRSKCAENGRRGGAPIGNINSTKNNQKQPKTTENKQKQTPNLTLPNLTNIKKTYGEFKNVKLTDEEFEKVKAKGWEGLLEELSTYIASKGDKYKSHYAVLTQWSNRREKEKPKVKPFQELTKSDYDFEELLKRKQVN